MTRPVLLVILDGFGLAPAGPGNAVELARTPVFERLWSTRAHATLEASGRAVGLPAGQMGNSEVGHLTIGAGRVLDQDLVRLSDAVSSGELGANPALVAAARRAGEARRPLHVIGLVSDGGVHSHVDHIRALVALGIGEAVPVRIHAITDGRDVSPHQAESLLRTLEEEWSGDTARIATVSGRFFAMDRDSRWERTSRFFDALVGRGTVSAETASTIVASSYATGVTDEFVEPVALGDDDGDRIRPGDEVIFANFRPDRTRQLSRALAEDGFSDFPRPPGWGHVKLTTMTAYWPDGGPPGVSVAFAPEWPHHVLADAVAAAGLTQLHAAETEKYPHVTYFLNGGQERAFVGEERIMEPSPRDVRTYDQRPAMSAPALAAAVAQALRAHRPDFAIVNFANPDMVGHTGVIPAVVEAVEAADAALGVVLAAIDDIGGIAIVTADHGNAEQMLTADGTPHTAHTTNPVPVVCSAPGVVLRPGGSLADLAPTVLDLLGVTQPEEMTGRSLCAPGGDGL